MLCVHSLAKPAKGLVLSTFVLTCAVLTACGGGGGGDTPTDVTTSELNAVGPGQSGSNQSAQGELGAEFGSAESSVASAIATAQSISVTYQASSKPSSRQEAARFLTQATFGPTMPEIDRLMEIGYDAWFEEQFSAPTSISYKAYWDSRKVAKSATTLEIGHAFWRNAIAGKDQLRQRMALALSEIFVISTTDGCGNNNPQGSASYIDMLGQRALGRYRDLLEGVTLHPVMGCYLSHLRNQKEDLVSGRVPDENYAREVMQLFSIGLYQLNADGTRRLNATGQPIDTYNADDIAGMAKVFTGWSLACPDWPSDHCFRWSSSPKDGSITANRWTVPMRPYANFHSQSEKRFLGTVIPAQSPANPEASLKIALDTLGRHPNVGPFIGKQLIQRFVTSNPSPSYVQRVSTAFANSGGDFKTTIKAVLLDPEARSGANISNPNFGKVREPILRLSALLRGLGAKSATGSFLMWNTNDVSTGFGQGILQAPSVFNYFRPGYVSPGSQSAAAGLTGPELQISHETTAASYVNFMSMAVSYGLGTKGYDDTGSVPDIRLEFQRNPDSMLYPLADRPAYLVEDLNQRLMYGSMSAALKADIIAAISAIDYKPVTVETRKGRLYAAVLLIVASPEFQVLK